MQTACYPELGGSTPKAHVVALILLKDDEKFLLLQDGVPSIRLARRIVSLAPLGPVGG